MFFSSPGYPRCKSLGLIEARRRDRGIAREYRIRGVKASASLKRKVFIDKGPPVPCIRGVKASASLKLYRCGRLDRRHVVSEV